MRCQKSPLWCRLTYGEEFSKIKPSGHMYDTKCIFSAHIMCMVHTPFKILPKILVLKKWKDYVTLAGLWTLFSVV